MRPEALRARGRNRLAALLALAAALGLAGRDFVGHAHAFDEVDLVAHVVAEPAQPHANSPDQPAHLEAGRDGRHIGCFECVLQALSPGFAPAVAALAQPLPRIAAPPAPTVRLRPGIALAAASPRGPPAAA